ncbi:MAG: hypothetical protein JKX75_00940 [Gammaproteobacteria bacterium]|nr:hypothetical protein [Gammaproteobacteria bacterium]
MSSYTMASAGIVTIYKSETSGLLTWTVENNGFKVELIQLLPDFIRAIYERHNFPTNEVERIASYCMFGTILKNTSNQHLSYRVTDWTYVSKAKNGDSIETFPVKTKAEWLQEWRTIGITFSWTLLPDIGEFSIGDWQQGFTSIQLPRESVFDLLYEWKLDGVEHRAVIKNIKCAPAFIQ